MKKLLLIAAAAMMGLGAQAEDWYLVGSSYSWDDNDAYKFTATENADEYTLSLEELSGSIKIKPAGDWSRSFGADRSNPQTLSSGTIYQAVKDGSDIVVNGPIKKPVIKINVANYTIEVTGAVEYPAAMYLFGQVNNLGWDPTNYVTLESVEEGVYSATTTLGDAGSGKGYFSFATNYGKNSTDWDALKPRYGATALDTDVVLGENMKVVSGENAFCAESNKEYTFTFNMKEMTVVVTENTVVADPELPKALTATSANGDIVWNADEQTLVAKLESNESTATLTLQIPEGFDNFVWAIPGASAEPLGTRAALTWVPVSEAIAQGYTLGNEITVATNGSTFVGGAMLVKGENFTPDMMYRIELTAQLSSSVDAIEVEGVAEYYTLQGVKVANPENGIFVKVVNGKASKVCVK
ncbi:MAG: hypothetical protein K2F64_02565 [Muribaculaceae bacterium]|nr:hypothetical protein [Muribaculaceae bacterium]